MAAPNNKFTDEQMAELRVIPYVRGVSRSKVYFTDDFKCQFWQMYKEENLLPHKILFNLGVDYQLLGPKRVDGLVQSIRKKFERESEAGQESAPLKSAVAMTPQRQIAQLQAEVEYLRQENEFFKQLSLGGQGGQPIKIPPSSTFEAIAEMMNKPGNRLNVKELCEIAGVSRSGYYEWLKAEPLRQEREEKDRADFDKILEVYKFRGYNKDSHEIHMRLLRHNPPILMNLKKVRRLTRKYGLQSPASKSDPHRRIMKALKESNFVKDILNTELEVCGFRSILLMDIVYLIMADGQTSYLSAIVDVGTREILAHTINSSTAIDSVLETIELLMKNHGSELKTDTLLYSDPTGCYTSTQFAELLEDSELLRSISQCANCWDKIPRDSLFVHLKEEIDISSHEAHGQIYDIINDWIDYYNNDRYQWNLAKLAPAEYYRYVTADEYPLSMQIPPVV